MNDHDIDDNETIANLMNTHFNEVGNIFGHSPEDPNGYKTFLDTQRDSLFKLNEIALYEVKKLLTNFKDSKSSNDHFPIRLFKLSPDNILKQLVRLYNASIQNGIFPRKLKYSIIIPIHKQGSTSVSRSALTIDLFHYLAL